MQTFGRLRLDVENCVTRARRLRRRARGRRQPAAAVRRPSVRPTKRLVELLDHFLERRAAVSTEDQSPSVQRFREMIGRDEKMLVVFEWIRTAAKSDISVLILGPTGSGKEVVARMIHELSRRSRGEVPGGQLRRAARHAVRVGNLRLRKRRVHRRARPQAGPARARQRGHAVPRRDRRHVADRAGQAVARARGAPLRAPRRAEVDLGRFPPDLGDQPPARAVRARRPVPRGSVLPRQRVRDPAAVAARAAGRHSRARASASSRGTAPRRGCRSTARASRAKRSTCSCSYHWPGNIRELESTVSRAALSAPGPHRSAPSDIEFLHANDADADCRPAIGCRRWPRPSARTSSACSRPSEWNKKEAARVLDISRGTLYRKIVEYQLEPEAAARRPPRARGGSAAK